MGALLYTLACSEAWGEVWGPFCLLAAACGRPWERCVCACVRVVGRSERSAWPCWQRTGYYYYPFHGCGWVIQRTSRFFRTYLFAPQVDGTELLNKITGIMG